MSETAKGDIELMGYDFKRFTNVNITGIDISSLNEEELSVLYVQARYCQAMTDADIETMRELVSEDMVYTHMSGLQQTREEYFADIADGNLRYFTIGIADPVIKVEGEKRKDGRFHHRNESAWATKMRSGKIMLRLRKTVSGEKSQNELRILHYAV